MDFKIGIGGEVKLLPVFKKTDSVKGFDELYSYIREKELFKGEVGELYTSISYSGDKCIILGLGEEEKITQETIRKAFFKAGKEAGRFKVNSIGILIGEIPSLEYERVVQAVVEGLMQTDYYFEKYISEKKTKNNLKEVYLEVQQDQADMAKTIIEETRNIIEGVFLARDLANEPSITMTPSTLAHSAKEELESLGVSVEIYDRAQIQELGMDAFLAVSKGSDQEPRLIVMNYEGNPDSDEKIALVGKGLTYDSGGYSIKSSGGMVTMHADMAGSASVIGTMKAIASSKLKSNVVGVVAACENLISGKSYKPGDIIGSMSGKTIEVLNTDAEGRLTLADALWYAVDVAKANKVIDIATLTGACYVALGDIYTGAITNNKLLMEDIIKAADCAGEPVWELPNDEAYKKQIKGTFADLKNVGDRGAGAITAGLFLREFVKDTPWVHLDVAGTAHMSSNPNGYLPKGATGVPVKTLYYLVKGY